MSYSAGPVPHATLFSSTTQTVASTTVAYPVHQETTSDVQGIYQKNSTVTITIASPGVISWTGHGLAINEVVKFTTTGALPTGLTAGTPYWIISAGFGADSFQVSASYGGAAVNTSGSQSGTHTCTCISRIYVPEHGDYLLQISALVDTTSAASSTMDIWFDVDGTNLDNSNTVVAVDSVGIQAVVAVPIILDMNLGSYVKIFYRGSSTNMRLLAVAAAASPTRPACPSIITTIHYIGR